MPTPITLDQQMEVHGPDLSPSRTGENTLILAKLGLEPMGGGVRVTARDEHGKTLWGFVASPPMLASGECLIGIYDRLLELLREKGIGNTPDPLNPAEAVSQALSDLEALSKTVEDLKTSLDVKKPSKATARRAEQVSRLVRDAALMLRQGQVR